MNSSILREFGDEVSHVPATPGPTVSVRVARRDPSELAAGNGAMTLFGDATVSGFQQLPAKNDTFIVGGVEYRAFDVQGPDESGGLHIHLTR